ncbi:Stk1 family PASTA domain-containing Ser/Thr kinase [Thermicanus aegyptius]|uniref:Stk1 family PASTA domain-containing Ser/Thr kinase n=1 Tax=Thermicanus aegyptius TaxID=94009 RepID=UPI0003F9AF8F|nr:Stk1 family PASTA domain-containing Ser/Thr kinase [Thermicanus aegyptius]
MSEKRLGGRYELTTRVGGGGMAVVYKGHDLLLDRTVAVKVLRPQFGQDEEFIRRFRREAQAAARLSHPNVVSIYDVGQEEDTHYIVMEYVDGETLKDLIKREAPLDVKKAVHIAIQIGEALEHAHQHHIIHRDIKPHNILIGTDGRVKVTDFGIARAVTSATITQTGSVLGTVHYFSPEQARGGVTGEKSDLYSLGIVLYEMVTGHLPFSGESPISVALKHLQEHFKDPRELNPSIPQSVENIILKALCKQPEHRYESAHAMVEDLKTCLSPERLWEEKRIPERTQDDDPTLVLPAVGARPAHHSLDLETQPDPEDERGGKREKLLSRSWVKALIWILAIVVVIGLTFFIIQKIQSLFVVPEIEVPLVINMPLDKAELKLAEAGLKSEVQGEVFDDRIPAGNVVKQDPPPKEKIKAETPVMLTVSKGKETTFMPDLTLKEEREAQTLLVDFKEVKITREYSDTIPAGQVMSQNPLPQTPVVPKETVVELTVSKGKEAFDMPNLIGKTKDQAAAILLKNGLILKGTQQEESYFDKGLVVRQWPVQPGEKVSAGQEITIVLSSGLKADAVKVEEPIMAVVEPDKPTTISILVSDARYQDYPYIEEKISKSKEYSVDLVLSPTHDATITVYKDGVLQVTRTVTYQEVTGTNTGG